MKMFIFGSLTLIISAMSTSTVLADSYTGRLNPMVLIELNASIKADWVMAERLLALDIKDELHDKKGPSYEYSAFLSSPKIATNLVVINSTNGYVAKI